MSTNKHILISLNGCGWNREYEGDDRHQVELNELTKKLAALIKSTPGEHLGSCKTVSISHIELLDHIHYRIHQRNTFS